MRSPPLGRDDGSVASWEPDFEGDALAVGEIVGFDAAVVELRDQGGDVEPEAEVGLFAFAVADRYERVEDLAAHLFR